MQNFVFQTAPTIIMESGAAKRLGQIVAGLGVKRVAIVTDPGIAKAGLLDVVQASVKEAGLEFCTFADVLADPPEQTVLDAVKCARDFNADGVVGLGGGSSMDTAKVVSFLVRSTQTLTEILVPLAAKGPRLPLVQVPTTSGTGSEVTAAAVISCAGNQKKAVVAPQLYPDIALLDPDLTLGLPPHVTAATGMDAMVHAIEGYTSRVRKNPISDMVAREAMRLLVGNIRQAVKDGSDKDARANMLLGAMYAGQSFGNATVGAVHAFAHTMGGNFHIPHGLANSLMLPHVMRFNLPVSAKEYAELADVVIPGCTGSNEEKANKLIEALEALSAEIKLETKLSQVGIKKEDLTLLATEAMKEVRILSFNSRAVTYDDALAMFTQAL